jgi:hypothetical protein
MVAGQASPYPGKEIQNGNIHPKLYVSDKEKNERVRELVTIRLGNSPL